MSDDDDVVVISFVYRLLYNDDNEKNNTCQVFMLKGEIYTIENSSFQPRLLELYQVQDALRDLWEDVSQDLYYSCQANQDFQELECDLIPVTKAFFASR